MSAARVCDNCGEVMVVDNRGNNDDGEEAAWLRLASVYMEADLCSRACVVEYVEDDAFVLPYNAGQEAVAGVVRAVNEDDE